jgi:hypothetical protein
VNIPEKLVSPLPEFAEAFVAMHDIGLRRWEASSVAFVGLARNCAPFLQANLARLEVLASSCRQWKLHIVTNDNDDETPAVLEEFSARRSQATFSDSRLGRQQYTSEFAGRRTEALAEYRTACQSWVLQNALASDLVVVIDFDSWGGWSHHGSGCRWRSIVLLDLLAKLIDGRFLHFENPFIGGGALLHDLFRQIRTRSIRLGHQGMDHSGNTLNHSHGIRHRRGSWLGTIECGGNYIGHGP